jgi:hypothetical protein
MTVRGESKESEPVVTDGEPPPPKVEVVERGTLMSIISSEPDPSIHTAGI